MNEFEVDAQTLERIKKRGIELFKKRDYALAQLHFSIALEDDKDNPELKFLSALAGLTSICEYEAYSAYEYFMCRPDDLTKEEEQASMNLAIIDEILENYIRKNSYQARDIRKEEMSEDGVLFEDFIAIVESKGSFKEVFENLMCSSRLVITKKSDFIKFLDLLRENGYKDMSLKYIERALSVFPADQYFIKLLIKATKEI